MTMTTNRREGNILVADDEKAMRELLARALLSRGFTVETASNGAEALEKIQEQPFDMLITDLVMPNIVGMELVQKARQILPDLIVIVITGNATL